MTTSTAERPAACPDGHAVRWLNDTYGVCDCHVWAWHSYDLPDTPRLVPLPEPGNPVADTVRGLDVALRQLAMLRDTLAEIAAMEHGDLISADAAVRDRAQAAPRASAKGGESPA